VVDAGGKGIVVLLQGAVDALKNGLSEDQICIPSSHLELPPDGIDIFDSLDEDVDILDLKYCTEFLLKGTELVVDSIRQDLVDLGDSLLVVGTSELVKIHIHTNNPGLVLEYAVSLGDLSEIKIDNMAEQNELHREATNGRVGIVAVAAGTGIAQILRGLGVDEIVQGGQTMNPSIEDLSRAVEKVKTESVIILSNNSNVILTAEQVKNIARKKIDVLPSKSVVEGITALLGLDRNADIATNMESLTESLNGVKAGEVTYAVRDWESDEMVVNEKDYIGLYNRELKAVGKDLDEVVSNLLEHMVDEADEVITLYYGEDVSEDESSSLCEKLQNRYSWCDIEVYFGGQPLYYYLISVE
jgi:DAK2 domain fusion protein YloV